MTKKRDKLNLEVIVVVLVGHQRAAALEAADVLGGHELTHPKSLLA